VNKTFTNFFQDFKKVKGGLLYMGKDFHFLFQEFLSKNVEFFLLEDQFYTFVSYT